MIYYETAVVFALIWKKKSLVELLFEINNIYKIINLNVVQSAWNSYWILKLNLSAQQIITRPKTHTHFVYTIEWDWEGEIKQNSQIVTFAVKSMTHETL